MTDEPQLPAVRTAPDPAEAEKALADVKRIARLLDDAVRVPGTRAGVGLDGLIGLAPVAGDIVGVLLSAWMIRKATQAGADDDLRRKMWRNVIIDVVVGLIPGLGDIFDLIWKSNRKNADLLEAHVERVKKEASG